jgi:3-oxoacyl-[acyl-carrier-protein] synthase-3
MKSAYINSIGKFLPGEAIDNNSVEEYLGKINGKPSKVKQKILQNNGIKQRYYALDRQQNNTYSNSDMAVRAIQDTLAYRDLNPTEIDLLACSTTLPDLLIPGFASMVHGQLPGFNPLEIVLTQGVCCAGVTALNYAVSQIKLGQKKNAIAVASELASRLFINSKFEFCVIIHPISSAVKS